MKWENNIADQNFKDFNEFRTYRQSWFKDAIKYRNFRNGFHFSTEETEEILKLRQAPIPINITAAICETAEALLTANDPIITVTPARVMQEENRQYALAVANLYEAALKASWYNSRGSLQFDRTIKDYNDVGRGLQYIIPKFKDGIFTVDIKYLSFRDYYPDPACREPDYQDSDCMIISYVTSMLAAFKHAQMYDTELEFDRFKKEFQKIEFIDNPISFDGDKYLSRSWKKENTLRIIIKYALEKNKIYYVTPVRDVVDEVHLQKSLEVYIAFADQNFIEVPDEVKELEKQNLIEIHSTEKNLLTEYISFGKMGLKKVYPIDMYNIIPFVYDHNDHPYPLGRVHYIYPLQRSLNKALMISLLNASLSNSEKWLYEDKSIIDLEQWSNSLAIPGAMLPYRRVTDNTIPPQPINAKPLSDVFLQYPQYLQYMMEYVSGISNILMGITNNQTPDVYKTIASMQTASGERIKRRLRNIDSSLSLVGLCVAKFYKEYAPYNGDLTWVENYNSIKQIEYNKLEVDPNNKLKIRVKPDTNLKIGFRDLRFVSQSNQGYENANIAQLLTLLGTQLSIPEVVPIILKKLNIPEAEEIIQNMDIKKQAQMTIEQLQQKIQQLEKIAQSQAKEIEQKAKEITVSDAKIKATRFLEGLKTKFKDDLNKRKEIDELLNAFNPNQTIGGQNGITNATGNEPIVNI